MKTAVFWDVMPCGSCKNGILDGNIDSMIRVTIIGKERTLGVTSNRTNASEERIASNIMVQKNVCSN
jgi:hypothetical protein